MFVFNVKFISNSINFNIMYSNIKAAQKCLSYREVCLQKNIVDTGLGYFQGGSSAEVIFPRRVNT